jgi:nicotinate-nucleotide--dimethylbenzimidazole phosphoribosyltransferase
MSRHSSLPLPPDMMLSPHIAIWCASARWGSATQRRRRRWLRRCLAAAARIGPAAYRIDEQGLARKRAVIDRAVARHAEVLGDPLLIASALGGRELAAILGAVLAARIRSIPVVLDGFVSTAAAAPLKKLDPQGLAHTLAGHVSAEAGHRKLLDELGLPPLLDLGMRLGEGSGAAVAVLVLRAALACHIGMATFAQAKVSKSVAQQPGSR